MTTTLTMPEVAETVVEGTIARWLKNEGERVEEYEPLVEVVTDKVNIEVPSPASGVLSKILASVDEIVPIGAELAYIEEAAEAGAVVTAVREVAEAAGTRAAETAVSASTTTGGPSPAGDGGAPRLSPLVRRLAAEHGVDVTKVAGTGIGGRVRKQDILDFVAAQETAPATVSGDVEAPLSAVRATIARRMVLSSQEVPHAWTTMEVDVTGLVALREGARAHFLQTEGVNLTYLPFFIKAVVGALKEHPELNASWADGKITRKKEINIGIAVDRSEGLIVPVVRHADEKSVAGLAKELYGLIERARENKSTLDDVQGGTFTVNNTGAFGAILSMPIVNQPQAAILATEAIVKRAVVIGDGIAVRSMMNISISFDHRVLDGGQVGRFMQAVKRALESYSQETLVY